MWSKMDSPTIKGIIKCHYKSIRIIVIFIIALPIVVWTVYFQMTEPSAVVAEYLLPHRIIVRIVTAADFVAATVVAGVIACTNK